MTSLEPTDPVSRFALYGEVPGDDDPEFVHIEDIRVRSSLYDWHIGPHTHRRMFQIVYLIDGRVEARIEDRLFEARSPCAVCVPGDTVHSFTFAPDTIGYVVTVSDHLLLATGQSQAPLARLLEQARIVSVEETDPDAALAAILLQRMAREFQARDPGRNAMFEWLFQILSLILRRRIASQGRLGDRRPLDRQKFFEACRLIEAGYRAHRPVTDYAARLAVSQSRLNRLCRQFAGKTFSDLLQDRIALEAQRYLIYTSATVEMIADELGFSDPGYFCRFFKRRTGVSPGRFRRDRRGGKAQALPR